MDSSISKHIAVVIETRSSERLIEYFRFLQNNMRLFVQVAESPLRTDCGQHVVMDRGKFQIVDWVNDE
jgi:hypothetical protein